MNLLQRAVVKTLTALRAYPSPQPLTWDSLMREMGGYRDENLAGIAVNEYTALNYSPVWCGVATLSNDVAKLPLVLNKILPNGGKARFTDHRLYKILHDEPNPEMSSFKFRETMQALCLLYGNAYAEIVRDEIRRPEGLYPIDPARVTPVRDDNGRLVYRVTQPSGGQKFLRPGNMIHISSLCTDGIIGHSIVEHGSQSIGLGVAMEKFGAAFFGNGSTFGGVVEVPQPMDSQEKKDNIRTAIEAVHRGVERAHKILVLAGGAKFSQRGTSQNDSQYNETRAFQIAEVSRWLRMPPHKLGDYEHAHFDNIELSNLDYWRGRVAGDLKMWEQELKRKLVSPLEYSQQSIDFVMAGELRGDSAARSAFYKDMMGMGVFSINDVLRLEDMNPIGPEGDAHLVPLNLIPIERYSEYIDATIAAKTPAALPPAAATDPTAVDQMQRALAEAQTRAEELVATAVDAAHKAGDSAEWRAAAEQAKAEAATAARDVLDARERLRLATEQRDAAEAERDAETAAKLAAELRATALASKAEQLEVAELEAHEALTLAEALLQTQRAALETAEQRVQAEAQAVAEAQAKLTAMDGQCLTETARAVSAEQAVEAVRATADATAAALAARSASLTVAETELATARAAMATADTVAQDRRATELDRLTSVIGAHRALIVDAMGRMVRRETEKARRHQGSPDKLRQWAEAFYQTHEETCVEAILPVVRTHLAWKRSEADPVAEALTIVRAHIEQSLTQLRAVIDGSEPEEFAVALETVLRRWETDRPHAMADGILRDEVAYVRAYR